MSMFFFTFRARTQARMGAEILKRSGIPVKLDRTPSQLAKNGCGFGLWVPGDYGQTAAEALREGNHPYTKSYRFSGGGFREVRL